jgi:hypothetical protein
MCPHRDCWRCAFAPVAREQYHHDTICIACLKWIRDHGALVAGVFEAHDRARFETTALSPPMTEAKCVRGARLIRRSSMSKREAIRGSVSLKEREIDIAVDLMGFTTGGRPGILACRPAPLQVVPAIPEQWGQLCRLHRRRSHRHS